MKKVIFIFSFILFLSFLEEQNILANQNLTMEQRIKAQEAIERVYYEKRLWPKENPNPKPPFEKVVKVEIIEEKVIDYIKKSNALEKFWKRPIKGEQLQAEIERMAENTRDPETLKEIFKALNNDPFLIAECLGRQTLSERLATNWYSFDERFHFETKEKAENAYKNLTKENFSSYPEGEHIKIIYILAEEENKEKFPGIEDDGKIRLNFEEFEKLKNSLPEEGKITKPEEDFDGFTINYIKRKENSLIEVEKIYFKKVSFESWWEKEKKEISTNLNIPAFNYTLPEIKNNNSTQFSGSCTEAWTETSMTTPMPRAYHTAVWTGNEMIVFGGTTCDPFSQSACDWYETATSGNIYYPSVDIWKKISTDKYSSILGHTAVWTGTEMILYGGRFSEGKGVKYNPANNTFTQIPPFDGIERAKHSAVWTGSKMIIWGGCSNFLYLLDCINDSLLNSGGIYDPQTDTWVSTPITGDCPSPRYGHTAVWTGTEMIIWGGSGYGGRYNPLINTWVSINANITVGRWGHTAVWTGTEMIIWGGEYNTGGRYNPSTDTWIATSTRNAPYIGSGHTAVWTGNEMIVWGGGYLNTGGRYDPSTDTWVSTSKTNAPSGRYGHTAVWTGSEMIVWGGVVYTNTGGRYDPSTDSWVPTSAVDVTKRKQHKSVWTGSEMLVWGGEPYSSKGLKYFPSIDSWKYMSETNAPFPRKDHTMVWTGSDAIVWGGRDNTSYFNSGGIYNVLYDIWTETSLDSNCPSPRYQHTALWNGSKMLVWGGKASGYTLFGNGGEFDPISNSWERITEGSGSPLARTQHCSLWTGDKMFIWGGYTFNGTEVQILNDGFLYNPLSKNWEAVSTEGSPSGRYGHSCIWTGSNAIVWGGFDTNYTNTGGIYSPFQNLWSSTSIGTNTPSGRSSHTAVFTGNEMIVWGGENWSGTLSSGGRYGISANNWYSMATDGNRRVEHSSVWTGNEMVVFGGTNGVDYLGGNIYYYNSQPPQGLSEPSIIDNEICSTGLSISWATDPAFWNDSGEPLQRKYRVYRNGSPITSGGCSGEFSYGNTSCTDNTTQPMENYNYQIYYKNSCNFGSLTPIKNIQDKGFIKPIIEGQTPSCVPLLLSTGNYANYQWYFNDSIIEGANGKTYLANQAGNYKVETTDGNNCSGFSDNFYVNPLPVPEVLGPSEGCGYVELSTQNFNSYQWYRNGNIISGANSRTYTAYLSGNYSVRVQDQNGCFGESSVKAVSINIDPEPQISPLSKDVCVGANAQFNITASGNDLTYLWRKNGNPLSDNEKYRGTRTNTLIISNITTEEAGNYDCLVTSGPCERDSEDAPLNVHSCDAPVLNPEPAFTQGTSNQISWSQVSGASGYEAQVSNDNFQTILQSSGVISSLNYVFSGLSSGINYQYRVQANFPYGKSPWSQIQNSTQDAELPSSAISYPLPNETIFGSSINVTGTANDSISGISKIEISWNNGNTWHQANGTTQWNYNWVLPADGNYTLLSRAYDNVNNIEIQHGIPVTIRNIPMPATNVTVSDVPYDGGGVLDINWTLSSDDGGGLGYVAGYSIWRANSPGGPFTQIGSVPAGINYFQDTNAGTGIKRYYKVRTFTGFDVIPNYSDSSIIGPVQATDEPPLPVNNLQADLTSGCNVRLNWIESPSPDVFLYNIYYDAGTGNINWSIPIGTVNAPNTTWVSSGLPLNTRFIFSVRAKDLAGQEDGLTTNIVSISTECISGLPRAEITHPQPGRKVKGSNVSVKAQLIQGTPQETSGVLFQYRQAGGQNWVNISVEGNEQNPDPSSPYLIHWNTTVIPNGNYDLRAVAHNLLGTPDPEPPYITVTVANGGNANISENNIAGDHHADIENYKGSGNLNVIAFERDNAMFQVNIPKGGLPVHIDISNIKDLDPSIYEGKGFKGILAGEKGNSIIINDLTQAGIFRVLELESGRKNFSSGIDLIFYFKDENRDGILDGTNIPITQLDVFLDEGNNQWALQNTNRTLDTVNNYIRVTVTKTGTYGLFTFPKPKQVENLMVEKSGNDAKLFWSPVTQDEKGNSITIDHYNIYAGSTPSFYPDLIAGSNRIGQVSNVSFYDLGILQTQENRFYLITAVDISGRESYPR